MAIAIAKPSRQGCEHGGFPTIRDQAYPASSQARRPMNRADLVKLARILGMLGSDHAGERAAAALAAHRLVKRANASWWSLLSPAASSQPIIVRAAWVDPFTDFLRAAQSRVSQVEKENERLRRENDQLRKQSFAAREKTTTRPAQILRSRLSQ